MLHSTILVIKIDITKIICSQSSVPNQFNNPWLDFSIGFATASDTMGFLEALLESLGTGLEHAEGVL